MDDGIQENAKGEYRQFDKIKLNLNPLFLFPFFFSECPP